MLELAILQWEEYKKVRVRVRVRSSKIEVRCGSACGTIIEVRVCVRHTVNILATQHLEKMPCILILFNLILLLQSRDDIGDGHVMEPLVEKYVKFFRSILHRNNYYFAKFVCCEGLNLVMLYANFYLTDVFINGNFWYYGYEVFQFSKLSRAEQVTLMWQFWSSFNLSWVFLVSQLFFWRFSVNCFTVNCQLLSFLRDYSISLRSKQ